MNRQRLTLKYFASKSLSVALLAPLWTTLLTAVSLPVALAQTPTESQSLSLQECLTMALRYHPQLQRARLATQAGEARLSEEWANYGLTFGANASLRQNASPASSSFIEGAAILNQTRQQYNLYLDQDVATGGNIRLSLDNSVLNTNSTRVDFNPAVAPQLGISLTQPLLRNAFNGFRNLEIQEQALNITRQDLKQTALETAFDVQSSYWNLVRYQEQLGVLKQSLNILNELWIMNQEKEKAGFLSRIDVLQTQARIASRQANLLDAERNLANTLDQLKQYLNPDQNPDINWEQIIAPRDTPEFVPRVVNAEESYATALAQRPDYLAAQLRLKTLQEQERIAAQNLLPQLQLQSSAGLEALDDQYGSALSQLFSMNTYYWSAGLNFEIPVVGNTYVAQHKQRVLARQQQEQQLEFLRQQIRREIRQAIRNVELVGQQVEATRQAKALAEEQLKAQTEKLNLGLTTNFQVLQFQQDFENASLAEVNATLAYIQALNALASREGTLLKVFGLENDVY